MKLDITSLQGAIEAAAESLAFYKANVKVDGAPMRVARSASVKGFELVYEVSIKMIRRQLDEISSVPGEVCEMSFPDQMRDAQSKGLIRDVVSFRRYRELRNISSHTYDAIKAVKIAESLPNLLDDARYLVEQLQHYNDSHAD
jgi:nucleotidyltransferase substrate binding protein (TIGR01987 family)